MIDTIGAAFHGIKGALDIAQGWQSLKTETAVNTALVTIQRSLLEALRALNDAEARHTADIAQITALEQEIVRLKDWSAEKEKYQLVTIDHTSFAYMPKIGMENGQPAHWLCTNCFEHGRRSLMQHKGTSGESLYCCNACKAEFRVRHRISPEYAQRDTVDQ